MAEIALTDCRCLFKCLPIVFDKQLSFFKILQVNEVKKFVVIFLVHNFENNILAI